jgi:hypothetical protein
VYSGTRQRVLDDAFHDLRDGASEFLAKTRSALVVPVTYLK